MKIVYPTNENVGFLSQGGAHFGRAKFYTVITLQDNKIIDVKAHENQGHKSGACGAVVSNIMALKPDALVLSGISASPAKGFAWQVLMHITILIFQLFRIASTNYLKISFKNSPYKRTCSVR